MLVKTGGWSWSCEPRRAATALAALDASGRDRLLQRSEADLSQVMDVVQPIIEAVRLDGDEALLRFARGFDGATISADRLKVSDAEFDAAFKAVDGAVQDAIRFAVGNIRRFHEEQRPEPLWLKEMRPGA